MTLDPHERLKAVIKEVLDDGTQATLASLEARIDGIKDILIERKEAVRLAYENMGTRLDHLNEWKELTIKRDEQTVTKDFYDREHQPLVKRVEDLEKWQSKILGIGAVLILLAGLIGYAISHFTK